MLYSRYEEIYSFDAAKENISENIVRQLLNKDFDGDYTFFKADGTQAKYPPKDNDIFHKNSFMPKVHIYEIKNEHINSVKIEIAPFKLLEVIVLILMLISLLFFIVFILLAYYKLTSITSAISMLAIAICSYFMPYIFYTMSAKKILKNFDKIAGQLSDGS
ncbi:MAG: hypothetical protein IJZ35_00770 [Clostridia bacterium]|nr:hypothetical protein [Clostridia bacterium]